MNSYLRSDACGLVGDLNPPSGYAFGTSSTNATCSTWGNPKTAVAHHQRFRSNWCGVSPNDETDN
ncbi:hypothetical protein [Scytonema sp. HK-05]|uniref:hypothetical protein n=1 Tax=Scytonema sp. HK-05 TaxID=1137095 RepID=UPI0011611D67|nr:hypothetical protein [Scytonema sp. HK-05]